MTFQTQQTSRRDFVGQLGLAAAALTAGATMAHAEERPHAIEHGEGLAEGPWDLSWVDKLNGVPYRVVFDANNIADGYALDLAAGFLDQYHDVYGTRDDQTRAVIVMRQLGTPMAMGDVLWDQFAVGEELKINDPATHQPARRNVFLRSATGSSGAKLETLGARGTILLVCSVAANNWASRQAEKMKRPVEEVRAQVRSNLAPGVILVPSGIFALIRAQNAGCAFMRGA